MKIADFKGTEPAFDPFVFFAGHTQAKGIFEDRFGTLRRSFVVDIVGTVEGDTLTLVEDFVYDDGEVAQRIWSIKRTSATQFTGTAGDVIGVATGEIAGKAMQWRYELNLKVGNDVWPVRFDDWMFALDKQTMINRARIYRWGFEIGEVSLFFTKGASATKAGAPPAK